MSIFARIRIVWKFRHRSLRIFSNFEKIFIDLGDTAPQSWTHFGNFRKIQDPSTTFWWESSKKCSRVVFSWFSKIKFFFTPRYPSWRVGSTSYLVYIILYTILNVKNFVFRFFVVLHDFFADFSNLVSNIACHFNRICESQVRFVIFMKNRYQNCLPKKNWDKILENQIFWH